MFISSFRLERKTPFSTGGNMWTCSNMQYIYNCVNENKPLLKKWKLVKMLNYDHIWNPCNQKAVCLYRSSIYKWHFTSCSWNTEILCCSLKWDDNTTICSRLTGKCLVRATKIQGCVIQQVKQLIGLLLFFFFSLMKVWKDINDTYTSGKIMRLILVVKGISDREDLHHLRRISLVYLLRAPWIQLGSLTVMHKSWLHLFCQVSACFLSFSTILCLSPPPPRPPALLSFKHQYPTAQLNCT